MLKDFNLPDEKYAQRLKLLYLRDILLRYTNETETLTRQDIEGMLAELGISECRKAFAGDIEALRQYGMNIRSTTGCQAAYQLMSRDFELAELKLLADVVSSSQFLTYEQSADLLHKIEGLCCDRDAKQIRRNVFVPGRIKQPNKGVLDNVDTIHKAISSPGEKFKISFKYFEYDMNRRRKYRDNTRTCTPYSLVWDRDHYYLVAWNDHRECYSNYRVDRMDCVQITNIPARPLDHDFDLAEYVMAHISMFSGEETEVKLYCDKSVVNAVLDRFGTEARIVPAKDGEHFKLFASVAVQPPFYAWLFQFGGKIVIQSPDWVRLEYIDMLKNVLDKA